MFIVLPVCTLSSFFDAPEAANYISTFPPFEILVYIPRIHVKLGRRFVYWAKSETRDSKETQ